MLRIENPRHSIIGALEYVVNKLFNSDWQNYRSIFSRDDLFAAAVQDNPLFVVHPGFRNYSTTKRKFMHSFAGYDDYLLRVQDTVREAVGDQKTVFLFTPTRYKRETLAAVGLSEKDIPHTVVLVPTVNNTTTIDSVVVGVPTDYFWASLGTYVDTAEVCGEWRKACLDAVEQQAAAAGIVIRKRADRIFPPE